MRPTVLPSAVHTASAPGFPAFAAQWLAYALPYRRFADANVDTLTGTLVDTCARLGADAVRYTFIVADFHRLLLAGFSGARERRSNDVNDPEPTSASRAVRNAMIALHAQR
jgi:hypothetical protein